MPQIRNKKGQFVKGCSGNPGGRPAIPESQRIALRELTIEAIEIKRQILLDDSVSLDLRNKVADSVLDRVYGRPGIDGDTDSANGIAKLDAMLEAITNAATEQ
jgi:hypothetical protein